MNLQDVKIWFICDRPSLKLVSACDISTHICPYWSTCYSLEVCHYATKHPMPSRLRKDIHLHFYTSSCCTPPRLKSYYLLYAFCYRFWHLRLQAEPGSSSCSFPSLHIHRCHIEQWVWDKGPNSGIVASYTSVQCWGLQHETLDWFFSNTSWKSMHSK